MHIHDCSNYGSWVARHERILLGSFCLPGSERMQTWNGNYGGFSVLAVCELMPPWVGTRGLAGDSCRSTWERGERAWMSVMQWWRGRMKAQVSLRFTCTKGDPKSRDLGWKVSMDIILWVVEPHWKGKMKYLRTMFTQEFRWKEIQNLQVGSSLGASSGKGGLGDHFLQLLCLVGSVCACIPLLMGDSLLSEAVHASLWADPFKHSFSNGSKWSAVSQA